MTKVSLQLRRAADPVRAALAINVFKPSMPFAATVLKVERLCGDSANPLSEVMHIVLDLPGGALPYRAGQSIGVLAPGIDLSTNRPHKVRLYSVASSPIAPEIGLGGRTTVTLCVKRVRAPHDDGSGTIYEGVCSNYLCNLKPDETVQVTGPTGPRFLLPKNDEDVFNHHYIFMATGTGIAPFRAMLREMVAMGGIPEHCQVRLFFGVKTPADLCYHEEFLALAMQYPSFKYHVVFSREGARKHVGPAMLDHSEDLRPLLASPKVRLYICGIGGMEKGIENSMTALVPGVVLGRDQYFEEVYGDNPS